MNVLINFMKSHGDVNENNVKIVKLGMDRLFACVSDITFVIIISAILNILWEGLLFELIYIPIRSYTGGYHAENKRKCIYLSACSTLLWLLLIRFTNMSASFWIAVCVIAWLVICCCAPVESKNKPLCEMEKKVFGRRAKIMSTISLLFSLALFFTGSPMLKSISTAMCSVLAGIVMAFMSKRERK